MKRAIEFVQSDVDYNFEHNPTVDFVYVTTSGLIFLPRNESDMKAYCKSKKDEEFEKVFRPGIEEVIEPTVDKAEDLNTASLIRLQELCAAIDPRCKPRSKALCIEFLEENKPVIEVVEGDEGAPVKTPEELAAEAEAAAAEKTPEEIAAEADAEVGNINPVNTEE